MRNGKMRKSSKKLQKVTLFLAGGSWLVEKESVKSVKSVSKKKKQSQFRLRQEIRNPKFMPEVQYQNNIMTNLKKYFCGLSRNKANFASRGNDRIEEMKTLRLSACYSAKCRYVARVGGRWKTKPIPACMSERNLMKPDAVINPASLSASPW